MKIILASSSPRRKKLFAKVVPDFDIVHPEINEEQIIEKDPVFFAIQAAVLKSKKVGEQHPNDTIVAADTVVSLENNILGKPKDYNDAKGMLKMLSGSTHKVITGIAIYKHNEDKLITGYELTYIKFKSLKEEDIKKYLDKNDYMDKAGSYAIQEVGDAFVEKIEGDYENVVGLPVKKIKKLLNRFYLPEYDTEIFDIAFPNKWAVGKVNEKIVFVPDAIFGDKIKVRIVKESKNFSYGETTKIVEDSPFKVVPTCPYFGVCGGCAFQDILYDKQIQLKEKYILTTLQKLGGVDINKVEKFPIIPSADKFFYRNKMEFAFGMDKGEIAIGLRERSSPFNKRRSRNNIISLEKCPIFSNKVETLFPLIKKFAKDTGKTAYDSYVNEGFFRHLVMREGKNTDEVMLILVTRSDSSFNIIPLADSLSKSNIALKSLWWVENDRVSDVVAFQKKNHLLGDSWIQEKVGNLKYKVYPSTFFQPNTKTAEILYEKIKENIKELNSKNVLGLYCGSGAIEIFISDIVKNIDGIDIEPANIDNAFENARINNITNCNFQSVSVEDIFKKASLKEYDTLILDPPRAGITNKALKNILSLNIPSIIYVSCNPATFARDIKKMEEEGYKLLKIYCADFFPHTPHIESMGVLTKKYVVSTHSGTTAHTPST
ncbi:23S rRNA (uracil(1939)-C(5))-methyltransferase RlmD [bacterium]|nr:23S rRNA (uracil(1939)-C(5))-methyltransferase RlmD [bacterium]